MAKEGLEYGQQHFVLEELLWALDTGEYFENRNQPFL